MPLFTRTAAPVALYVGEEQIVQAFLGDIVEFDGTTPALVFAPTMTATAAARVPGAQAGQTIAVPRMQATADVEPPSVTAAARIITPAMVATAQGVAPVVMVPTTVEVPAMTAGADLLDDLNAGALEPGTVLAPRLEATAEMPVPVVSAAVTVSVPPMTASVDAILGVIGGGATILPPGPAAAGATAAAPLVAAGANVGVPAATATATGRVPVVSVPATVSAPVATATAQMYPPVQFAQSGMNKNGNYTLTTSYTAVPTWTADTGGYAGSTTSGNGLVANGTKTNAELLTRLNVTNTQFGSYTLTIRLLLNGVVKTTTAPLSIGSIATANFDVSVFSDVTSGQVLTVEVLASNASTLRINGGTGSYVRIL